MILFRSFLFHRDRWFLYLLMQCFASGTRMRYGIVRQVVRRSSSLARVQPSRDDLVLSCQHLCLSVCLILGQFKDQHAFHLARPIVCLSRHDLGRVRAQQSMTAARPIHCRYSPCRCWFLARNGMFVLWPFSQHECIAKTRSYSDSA